jgi:hypothetical protein
LERGAKEILVWNEHCLIDRLTWSKWERYSAVTRSISSSVIVNSQLKLTLTSNKSSLRSESSNLADDNSGDDGRELHCSC